MSIQQVKSGICFWAAQRQSAPQQGFASIFKSNRSAGSSSNAVQDLRPVLDMFEHNATKREYLQES